MITTIQNTPANGGQILTDERIVEIGLRINAIESSNNGGYFLPVTFARAIEADLRASLAAPAIPTVDRNAALEEVMDAPKLRVWYGAMPESNGKSNFTAIIHAGDIEDGITLDSSEYPDRVRYEADRARYLIGELRERPFILDYDAEKRSDYVVPAVAQGVVSDESGIAAAMSEGNFNVATPATDKTAEGLVALRWPNGHYADFDPTRSNQPPGYVYLYAKPTAAPAPVSGMPDLASLPVYERMARGRQDLRMEPFYAAADVERLLNPTEATK